MKPATATNSMWIAEFWNVLASPWLTNGVICPPMFSAGCLSTRLRANRATLVLLKTRIARFLHDHKDALDSH
jgi:hypothetical protein